MPCVDPNRRRLVTWALLCSCFAAQCGAETVVWKYYNTVDCTGAEFDSIDHLGVCQYNASQSIYTPVSTLCQCHGVATMGDEGGLLCTAYSNSNCSGLPMTDSQLNTVVVNGIEANVLQKVNEQASKFSWSAANKASQTIKFTGLVKQVKSTGQVPDVMKAGDCIKTMDVQFPPQLGTGRQMSMRLVATPVSCGGDQGSATSAITHSLHKDKTKCLDTSVFETVCPRPSLMGNGFVPDTCPAPCATAFLDFFAECGAYIRSKISPAAGTALASFEVLCKQTVCSDKTNSGVMNAPCRQVKQYCNQPMFADTLQKNCPMTCGACGFETPTAPTAAPTAPTLAPTIAGSGHAGYSFPPPSLAPTTVPTLQAPEPKPRTMHLARFNANKDCSSSAPCVTLSSDESLVNAVESNGYPAQCTNESMVLSKDTMGRCFKSGHGIPGYYTVSCAGVFALSVSDFTDSKCTIPQSFVVGTTPEGQSISIELDNMEVNINSCTDISAIYVQKLQAQVNQPGVSAKAIEAVVANVKQYDLSSWKVSVHGAGGFTSTAMADMCGSR